MNKAQQASVELRAMDELAAQDSPMHRLSPLSKLFVTVLYIVVTVSFHKYDISGVFVMVLFPLVGYQVSMIPVHTCFHKLRVVMPLVCAVGLFNPFFDKQIVLYIGTVGVSGGVISMLTLMMKGVFCLMASFLLAATTSIEDICRALRQLQGRGLRRPDPRRHPGGGAAGRGGHHDGCLPPARAGAEGCAHLCLGLVPGSAAAAQHGPRDRAL